MNTTVRYTAYLSASRLPADFGAPAMVATDRPAPPADSDTDDEESRRQNQPADRDTAEPKERFVPCHTGTEVPYDVNEGRHGEHNPRKPTERDTNADSHNPTHQSCLLPAREPSQIRRTADVEGRQAGEGIAADSTAAVQIAISSSLIRPRGSKRASA